MKKRIKLASMLIFSGLFSILPAARISAAPIENIFGGGGRDIHFVQTSNPGQSLQSENNNIHFITEHFASTHSNSSNARHINYAQTTRAFRDNEEIGTLTIHRLNRTIRVFESESMRAMDYGAGRFVHSGINYGNTALIGHNHGHNSRGNWFGFFDFVRLLQPGDLISLEINGVYRQYIFSHEEIVHETDLSLLYHFGDNRLTLVTCVEYRNRYRRIAIATEVF